MFFVTIVCYITLVLHIIIVDFLNVFIESQVRNRYFYVLYFKLNLSNVSNVVP